MGKGFSGRLYRSPSLAVVSRPGESERDFRVRLQQTSHEQRDHLLEKIRQRYGARIASLKDRIRRAGQAVEREREQARHRFELSVWDGFRSYETNEAALLGPDSSRAGQSSEMNALQELARACLRRCGNQLLIHHLICAKTQIIEAARICATLIERRMNRNEAIPARKPGPFDQRPWRPACL